MTLARRPRGAPAVADFAIEGFDLPEPDDGELLVETRWLSIDPMFSILIAEAPLGGAFPPLPVGAPIPGAATGLVLDSRHPDFAPGDLVEGRTNWQDAAVVPGRTMRRIGAEFEREALGILGLPGLTAWAGLDLAGPIAGRTLLVSGAAGAVGGAVGQIARKRGARVAGIAGGEEKTRYLEERLGFDVALDYRDPSFAAALADIGPVDVYFDNIGGALLKAVLSVLAPKARIIVCGLMSAYASDGFVEGLGEDLLNAVMAKSLQLTGFNNRDFLERFDAFEAEVGAMLRSGEARERYAVLEGLDGAITHAASLYSGEAIGKRLVRMPAAARDRLSAGR